jgi:outer membrane autotransporter protein
VGLRRTELKLNGFTESGAEFPLTLASINQSSTDLLVGVSVSKKLREKLTGSLSLGVVQNLHSNAGQVSVSSDMGSYSSNLTGGRYTSASLGASLNYEIKTNHRIGVNVGWQQRNLYNANINSYGLNYTVGF